MAEQDQPTSPKLATDGSSRMRLVFLGSGAFGIPTFDALAQVHEIALVITQPDKPAGRKKRLTPTPIAQQAQRRNIDIIKPPDINTSDVLSRLREINPDAIVVIAYGQKIGRDVRDIAPTINLHGSLLPKYRGAAPINWAMINGESRTGVTVIDVADRMDAGAMYGSASTAIDPMETAGELHDRLADLGPELMLEVLDQLASNTARPVEQDESQATRAPKLTKQMGTVQFDQPAERVRATIHGLTPWPGCTVMLGESMLKLLRAKVVDSPHPSAQPGELLDGGIVACESGAVQLMSIQPPGGKAMTFEAYSRGHDVEVGQALSPMIRAGEPS